jgi:hypothetical protein
MLPQGSLVTAILPIITCAREFLRMHINLLLYINRNFPFTLHRSHPVQLKSYNTKISLRLQQFPGESGELSREKQQKSQHLCQESFFSHYLGTLRPLSSIPEPGFQQFQTSFRPCRYCQKNATAGFGQGFPERASLAQPLSPSEISRNGNG